MAVEAFYAEIGGSASGLIRAAGEGEAAAGSLEKRVAGVSGGMQTVGRNAEEHVGGTAVKNVGLLDRAFGSVFGSIKSVIGGMVSMVGQTAGIGALFGVGTGLVEGVKYAQSYNEQMSMIAAAYRDVGKSVPTKAITEMQDKMAGLGFTEDATNASLLKLAQAHLGETTQLQVMATAADLARAKGIDLATATDLILKAAQGTGRGLQDLGINLPATIPKMAALQSATAAAAKAQEAYNLALDTYGPNSSKTIAAHDKLDQATAKVSKDTAEMQNHFAAMPQTLDAINSRLTGSAAAYSKANPLASMGADLQGIARAAGEALLPDLDKLAGWVKSNEPALKNFATNAVDAIGTAATDAGGFIKNDLIPPAKDIIGFVSDHAKVFEGAVAALAGLYVVKHVASTAGTVFGDIKGLVSDLTNIPGLIKKVTGFGGGGSSVAGSAGKFVQDVYVTNWAEMGGSGGGAAVSDAEKGAGGLLGGSLLADAGGSIAMVVAPILNQANDVYQVWKGVFALSEANQQSLSGITDKAKSDFSKYGLSVDRAAAGAAIIEKAVADGAITTPTQFKNVEKWWERIASSSQTAAADIAGIAADAKSFAGGVNSLGQIIKNARNPHAAGGTFQAGETITVGEEGPETLTFNSGGMVYPGFGPGPSAGSTYGRGGGVTYVLSVAPGAIVVQETKSAQSTAIMVRDELLAMVGRGNFDRVFGGR